jgi:hypothetical protein
MRRSRFQIVLFSLLLLPLPLIAETAAEMQQRLNAETLNKSFEVEDVSKIDSYIAEASKKNLQPRKNPPSNWQPGYTCDSYYGRYHNYYDYRDCLYYHHYYGRFW